MVKLENGNTEELMVLDDKNFLLYSAKHYKNPHGDTPEFLEDIKRFKYLKKLFTRYKSVGELKERLILNHIIILYNVFGIVPGTRLLFLKLSDYKEQLKPFLELLSVLPEYVTIKSTCINTAEIESDKRIVEVLKYI